MPSIAWGLTGADYLTDDFDVAHRISSMGVVEGAFDLSFDAPARPLVGPYYLLLYEVIGERFLVQALLMGALNAALTVVVWAALRAVVGARTALLAALVFAVVPNRASTRLWFVLGPNLLAATCIAAGAVLLVRRRKMAATTLFVTGILNYEGVAGLAAMVLIWWWWQDRSERLRYAAMALVPVVVATATIWVLSPKRDGNSPGPFMNLDTIVPGLLGAGFWGMRGLAPLGMIAIIVAAVWCVATRLPSFRREGSPLPHELLVGSCLLGAAAAPLVVGGAPFAVRGIFDRNNLAPGVGSCLLVGAVLAAVWRWWSAVGWTATVVVVAVLAAGNVHDVRDYREAVGDGHALVEALLEDVDPTIGEVVVRPPMPGTTGVAQFIYAGDLTAAMTLRHGDRWSMISIPAKAPLCIDLNPPAGARDRPVFVYDRIDRTVLPASGSRACRRR